MTDDIRRRAACDRCHAQKIRCPKQLGQAACSRCIKSGSQCVFSPFRQKKPQGPESPESTTHLTAVALNSLSSISEPSGTLAPLKRRRVDESVATQEQVATNSISAYEPFMIDDMGLDWMQDSYSTPQDLVHSTFSQLDVDGQDMFPLTTETATHEVFCLMSYDPDPSVQSRKESNLDRSLKSNLLLNADTATYRPPAPIAPLAPSTWMPEIPSDEPISIGECIQRLSQLCSDLFEHKGTIPPLSIHDPENTDEDGHLQPGVKDYSQYVVEETFRLTQRLIEIYPIFLSTVLNHSSIHSTTPSFSWTTETNPSESSSTTPEDSSSPSQPHLPKQPLDHSSILLLLSCHIRIIEIYEELFKHMDLCIKTKGTPTTRRQNQVKAPQLSIGNYCPPPSSAIPMQMLLLIQFASQLFNYADDLAGEIEGRNGGEGREGLGLDGTTEKLTRAAAANVKDRALYMTKEIGSMRTLMLSSGVLA